MSNATPEEIDAMIEDYLNGPDTPSLCPICGHDFRQDGPIKWSQRCRHCNQLVERDEIVTHKPMEPT